MDPSFTLSGFYDGSVPGLVLPRQTSPLVRPNDRDSFLSKKEGIATAVGFFLGSFWFPGLRPLPVAMVCLVAQLGKSISPPGPSFRVCFVLLSLPSVPASAEWLAKFSGVSPPACHGPFTGMGRRPKREFPMFIFLFLSLRLSPGVAIAGTNGFPDRLAENGLFDWGKILGANFACHSAHQLCFRKLPVLVTFGPPLLLGF